MYDFHLHSNVSSDSTEEAVEIVKAAERMNLKEICFTDHYDYNSEKNKPHDLFTIEKYNMAYDNLISDKLKIRRGVEVGLTTWNQDEIDEFLSKGDFDFAIGSIHTVGGFDPYFKEFWNDISFEDAISKYMEQTLKCVKVHDNFDVLGHLTYVCKSSYNPTKAGISYREISDITDEIFRNLIQKGKGIEINTSGVDRMGDYLPDIDFVQRFRELGGEIVTVGSDAHDRNRVGEYIDDALCLISKVFPYVCTFEKRKPIFHKI